MQSAISNMLRRGNLPGFRGAVKLYCDFMQSDIIVASPIALATKLSEEAEEGGPADFLSSIEVVVVDRADVLLMQNWAHVVTGTTSSYYEIWHMLAGHSLTCIWCCIASAFLRDRLI